jgi:hypothetical protein
LKVSPPRLFQERFPLKEMCRNTVLERWGRTSSLCLSMNHSVLASSVSNVCWHLCDLYTNLFAVKLCVFCAL